MDDFINWAFARFGFITDFNPIQLFNPESTDKSISFQYRYLEEAYDETSEKMPRQSTKNRKIFSRSGTLTLTYKEKYCEASIVDAPKLPLYKGFCVLQQNAMESENQSESRAILWVILYQSKESNEASTNEEEKEVEIKDFIVASFDVSDRINGIFLGNTLTVHKKTGATYMHRTLLYDANYVGECTNPATLFTNLNDTKKLSSVLALRPGSILLKKSCYEDLFRDKLEVLELVKNKGQEQEKAAFRYLEEKELVKITPILPEVLGHKNLDADSELFAILLSYMRGGEEQTGEKVKDRHKTRGVTVKNGWIPKGIKNRILTAWAVKDSVTSEKIENFQKSQSRKPSDIKKRLESELGMDKGYQYNFPKGGLYSRFFERIKTKEGNKHVLHYVQLHPEPGEQRIQRGKLSFELIGGYCKVTLEEEANSRGHTTEYSGIAIVTNPKERELATAWLFMTLRKVMANGELVTVGAEQKMTDMAVYSFNLSPTADTYDSFGARVGQALTIASSTGAPTMVRFVLSEQRIYHAEIMKFFMPFLRVVGKEIYLERRFHRDLYRYITDKKLFGAETVVRPNNPGSEELYRNIEEHFDEKLSDEQIDKLYRLIHPNRQDVLGLVNESRQMTQEQRSENSEYVELEYSSDSLNNKLDTKEKIELFFEMLELGDTLHDSNTIAILNGHFDRYLNVSVNQLYRRSLKLRMKEEDK